MLKKYGIISEVGKIISKASDNISERIISEIEGKDIEGREEEITSQLKSEINGHLINEMKQLLDDKAINGVKFKIYTYKKHDEHNIGADLAGFLEIEGSKRISKVYLAQAKVCSKKTKPSGKSYYTAKYSRIQKQAWDMLNCT